ncbi:uncharacterized protein N7443_009826 [Penicillium atrosanguineum]|uniref:uncharacterized protein n=1 Tax=Penicillium atrosanguineum TaxID=1132637 RepID=UPI002397E3FE|nr:uncharacterized protein N7443_009826 [Penicillium atrosanguineum]KAJ5289573.1 hypothetical protein N7443_009826 [Penicillium atrosanguineum]
MKLTQLIPFVALAAAASNSHSSSPTPLTNSTVFAPPSDYNIPRTLYARNEQLFNGDLLATWENYSPEPPLVYFPIYRSKDFGKTWSELSKVHDTVNGFGLRYQPFLYYLPEAVGSFKAGTLLLAGNSIPEDLSTTHLDLYASHDDGVTWKFVSHIAAGGEAVPDNGLTPVWEPFLLAHAYPTYTDRPGMPTVAKLPNGQYIYFYEYGSFFDTATYSFPLYYRLSSNPEDFASSEGVPLIASSGTVPTSSPYVVWTKYGGKNGTIIASSGTQSTIFINQALGEGEWTEITSPESASYTRSLRILSEGNGRYLAINGGGVLGGISNTVSVSVVDLKKVL